MCSGPAFLNLIIEFVFFLAMASSIILNSFYQIYALAIPPIEVLDTKGKDCPLAVLFPCMPKRCMATPLL